MSSENSPLGGLPVGKPEGTNANALDVAARGQGKEVTAPVAPVDPRRPKSNANLINAAQRARGEQIIQAGGQKASGGGHAAQAAAARAAGYPPGVMPPHLRATEPAPVEPELKDTFVVGEYNGSDLLILAAELGGILVLIAATDESLSEALVPLPVGVQVKIDKAQGELVASGNGVSVIVFAFKGLYGRLIVAVSEKGCVSASWQAGAA